MLRIPRWEQPAGLWTFAAVEVVDTLAAIRSTNSALHLELRCLYQQNSSVYVVLFFSILYSQEMYSFYHALLRRAQYYRGKSSIHDVEHHTGWNTLKIISRLISPFALYKEARREGREGGSFPGDVWGLTIVRKYWKGCSEMASFWPQICIKSVFSQGSAPDPAEGASASRSRRIRNEVVMGPRDNDFPGPAVALDGSDYKPKHHGSTPKGTHPNFSQNRSAVQSTKL